MADMTLSELQKIGARVEILPQDGGPSEFRITVRSMPAPVGVITDKAAARRLVRELTLALAEDDEHEARGEKDKIRAQALRRRDHHVNPDRIFCAHDSCAQTFARQSADEHPWDGALAAGWVPIFESDLLCPESAKELKKS